MSPHFFTHWYLSGKSEFFSFQKGYYYSVYTTNFEEFNRVTSLKMLPWDGKKGENKEVAKWQFCSSKHTFFYNSSFHLLRKGGLLQVCLGLHSFGGCLLVLASLGFVHIHVAVIDLQVGVSFMLAIILHRWGCVCGLCLSLTSFCSQLCLLCMPTSLNEGKGKG